MSLRQKIARWLVSNDWDSSQVKKGSFAWTEMFGPVSGLPVPTETSALAVSAINACVFLLSGVIAALPLNVYRVDGEGFRSEIWGDDLWWVLNEEMTARWSAAAGWEFMAASLLLHGNFYARILRDATGRPIGIEPTHPNRVEVILDDARGRLVYAVEPDPLAFPAKSRIERRVYDQDDVLHVAGLGFDGIKGLSPLRYSLRMAGAVAMATQDYAANFFANSARPDYALVADKLLTASTACASRCWSGTRARPMPTCR